MMKNETINEFLKRGGTITMCRDAKAHGAQKAQKIKIPVRMGRKAIR